MVRCQHVNCSHCMLSLYVSVCVCVCRYWYYAKIIVLPMGTVVQGQTLFMCLRDFCYINVKFSRKSFFSNIGINAKNAQGFTCFLLSLYVSICVLALVLHCTYILNKIHNSVKCILIYIQQVQRQSNFWFIRMK